MSTPTQNKAITRRRRARTCDEFTIYEDPWIPQPMSLIMPTTANDPLTEFVATQQGVPGSGVPAVRRQPLSPIRLGLRTPLGRSRSVDSGSELMGYDRIMRSWSSLSLAYAENSSEAPRQPTPSSSDISSGGNNDESSVQQSSVSSSTAGASPPGVVEAGSGKSTKRIRRRCRFRLFGNAIMQRVGSIRGRGGHIADQPVAPRLGLRRALTLPFNVISRRPREPRR